MSRSEIILRWDAEERCGRVVRRVKRFRNTAALGRWAAASREHASILAACRNNIGNCSIEEA